MRTELILSIVVTASTFVYTGVSLMLWYESRATRRQKLEPLIVPYLKISETGSMLQLLVKNIGEGVAKNVELQVIEGINQLGKEGLPLSDLGIAKNGFNVFPPQYELKYYLDSMKDIYQNYENESITLSVSYESFDNRAFSHEYNLKFNQLFGQNHSSPPDTYWGRVPYYLKEINSSILQLNTKISSNLKEAKRKDV